MLLRAILLLLAMGVMHVTMAQRPEVTDLVCEYLVNPVGIDATQPRLSWKIRSGARDVMQSAYEIRVGTDPGVSRGRNIVWTSGKVASSQSTHVRYGGPALQSRQRLYWQVRIWDSNNRASAWSAPAFWEMGLLQTSDWSAQWIRPLSDNPEAEQRPVALLRKSFSVSKPVQSARLYVTSHGLYEAHLNGQRVGDAVLTPGWTSYNKRLQYQVYDVTGQIRNGDNAAGVMLADGWYRGNIGFSNQRNQYGTDIALLYQLEITYADGSTDRIISDNSWRSSTGALQMAEIYHGETYDARKEKSGWTQAGYNDSGWQGVTVFEGAKDVLVATANEPIRRQEIIRPIATLTTPKGETVLDFGQNLVGWLRFRISGPAGHTVKISHAEVLDKDGNFYIDNLRAAKAMITYTLKGGGEEQYEPRFTFMGFRYARLENFPAGFQPNQIEAVVLNSDMETTGHFECSHALVNQLQHNIQWGQKGNFLDVPTDCPQRDERLGWTGDAQVFARTAAFNMNVAAFFSKWLKDLAADQTSNGRVPFVIPNVLGENASASAGWADAATIIPWAMYTAYGDTTFLNEQYPSMKRWVDFMAGAMNENNLWNTGFHFGDWLFYRPFDDNDGRSAVTDKYLIAQSFFIHSTRLLIDAAEILGMSQDAAHYRDLLGKITDAYRKEYMTPTGRLVSGTQTAYTLALAFDILPESQREAAAARLVENIKQYGNHLTTGFLGTPYLCHVLSRYGYTDVAYQLLLQETYPSWLYPVKMGATTIWERWDGIKPDSTFQTPGMNSFNHYAYGAIGDWMYRTIAGINPDRDAPGYKHIVIAPQPGGDLSYAKASIETMYGTVASGWTIKDGTMTVEVTVPPNTTATITLPGAAGKQVTEGKTTLDRTKGVRAVTTQGKDVTFSVGSGRYSFTYSWQ
ncbi:MAG: glycoside hydrolase family 78 protein [Cyclobacteriaceae bacterium]|nr:glycoside hydrolase family 78 protein [Cyclobacteriaceae bacterium]